jgi:hypothetical protein
MRRGIGLRGYAQQDPLNEFRKEAFRLYEELSGFIRRQVATTIFPCHRARSLRPGSTAGHQAPRAGAGRTFEDGPPPTRWHSSRRPGRRRQGPGRPDRAPARAFRARPRSGQQGTPQPGARRAAPRSGATARRWRVQVKDEDRADRAVQVRTAGTCHGDRPARDRRLVCPADRRPHDGRCRDRPDLGAGLPDERGRRPSRRRRPRAPLARLPDGRSRGPLEAWHRAGFIVSRRIPETATEAAWRPCYAIERIGRGSWARTGDNAGSSPSSRVPEHGIRRGLRPDAYIAACGGLGSRLRIAGPDSPARTPSHARATLHELRALEYLLSAGPGRGLRGRARTGPPRPTWGRTPGSSARSEPGPTSPSP